MKVSPSFCFCNHPLSRNISCSENTEQCIVFIAGMPLLFLKYSLMRAIFVKTSAKIRVSLMYSRAVNWCHCHVYSNSLHALEISTNQAYYLFTSYVHYLFRECFATKSLKIISNVSSSFTQKKQN
jgi:hypothetical protein